MQGDIVYVGIDLGTTFSSIAFYDPQTEKEFVIKTVGEEDSIPSVVSLSPIQCLVGKEAIKQPGRENVIFEVKRFMGKNYDETNEELMNLIKKSPNKIISNENGMIRVEISHPKGNNMKETLILSPEQVSAIILLQLKKFFMRKFPGKTLRAVVGVPAMFGTNERKATENAVKMAGIELVSLINEPTAAAKAYQMNDGLLFVFDFGGGTLDISILEYSDSNSKVITSRGDSMLGGNDIDYNIMKLLMEKVRKIGTEDLFYSDEEIDEIIEKRIRFFKEKAEEMKKDLSIVYERDRMNSIVVTDCGFLGKEYEEMFEDEEISMTYLEFKKINEDVFKRCRKLIDKALEESGKDKNEITKVLMVGGSCKCPEVKTLLSDYFGSQVIDTNHTDFDLMVCKGLARFALKLRHDVHCVNESFGDVTSKKISMVVKDEFGNDIFQKIFGKNRPVPCKEIVEVTNSYDMQTSIPIIICEDGIEISRFIMHNVPPMKQGYVKIEIVFEIKNDGKLYVTGKLVEPAHYQTSVNGVCTPSIYNVNDEELKCQQETVLKLFNFGNK